MKRRSTNLLAATALCGALVSSVCAPAIAASSEKKPVKESFDIQAHRGGVGLTTESTLEAFGKALELGVTTLELDTQITEDGKVVVTHDRQVSTTVCQDTAPLTPGDPEYPYVGKYIKGLTLAQIQTMNCGYQQHPSHPQQEQIDGARMIELHEVFSLVKSRGAKDVTLNVETKVEAGAPDETAPRELFVRRMNEEIVKAGMTRQVTVQSFDWGALMAVHKLNPKLPLLALTNYDFLQVGQPGASPWLGDIDADDFDGDFVAAAASIEGVTALSPVHGFPQDGTIDQPGYESYVTQEMVDDAHARGLAVIPWTVDDIPTMNHLVKLGVDGIITDYPDRLRRVAAAHGYKLPWAYYDRPGKPGKGH